MKLNKVILFAVLLFIIHKVALGQEQRFNAGVIAGLNISALGGNKITDYVGLNAGVFSTTILSKNFQAGVEILFSQNGEYILPEFYPQLEYGKIRLNHLEIPVHIDWLIGAIKNENFHTLNVNLGVAYTRILGYYLEDINEVEVTDQLIYEDKDAFQLQAGLIYNFTEKIGVNLKASAPIAVRELGGTIALRMLYTIS